MDFLSDFEKQNNYKIAYGDISVLDNIENEYKNRDSDFSPFLKEYCNHWSGIKHAQECGMKSIIILSFPDSRINQMVLHYDNKTVNTIIPCGYLNYYEKHNEAYNKFVELLREHSINYVDIDPPLKNLAVRLGLAEYGRNNLTYVNDFGSYHCLIAVACDKKFTPEFYPKQSEPHRMEECDHCNLCVNACCNDAISKNDYLIDMQKCISLHNQELKEWPEFIDSGKRQFLIGCGACQMCCPRNKGLIKQNKIYEFSENETMSIVNDVSKDSLVWKTITEKLIDAGLNGFEELVLHNIKMIFKFN